MRSEETRRRLEYLADRAVHLVGLAAAPVAVAVLIGVTVSAGDGRAAFGVAVYGAGLLAMLGCSALYNLAPDSPAREWRRRLDHAAIYVMIAGTYTPFTLVGLPAHWGWLFCLAVWSVAAAGVALKLARPRRFERLSLALYLALGWSILLVIEPMLAALTATAGALLVAGGGLYSVGVIFHLWHRLPYQNAIWHGFVLLAAACHFAAIAITVTASSP
jgi:hemolysin III